MSQLGHGRVVIGAAVALASLASPAVSAQQQGSSLALPEIIVTAQKREERLVDVPVSVAVVSGDVLEDFKITALDDMDRLVPSLYINSTPGNNAVFVRGIGSTAGNLSVEQSVALFVDGVYSGRARQFMAPFLDVERVEVLRGPQGAIFGINTSAGAVSVTTAKPTKDFVAHVKAGYEFEDDSYELDGVVSGPLVDKLQGRLAVNYKDIGGYLKNTITGDDEPESENFLIRGSLAWQPTDAISALTKLEYAKFNTYGSNYQRYLMPEFYSIDDRKEEGGMWHKDVDHSEAWNFELTFNFDVGEGMLTSISAFSAFNYDKWINADQVPQNAWLTNFREDFQQFSQELRYTSPTGGLFEYFFGGYFHFNEIDPLVAMSTVQIPLSTSAVAQHQVTYTQDDNVYSLFGSLTWNINDQWSLTGDLRYTSDSKNAMQERHTISGTTPPSWGAQTLNGSRTDSTLDPAIKLKWEPDTGLMAYVSYTEGSKSGGWQGNARDLTAATWEIKGESSENYEAGVKAQLLEGRAFVALTIFDTEFENLQVSQWTGTSFSLTNAGKATSKGVELDGSWRIAEGWTLQGGLAYLDAEYDDFPGAPCPFDNPTCNPATNNLAGARLGWAPEWSGNLSLTYQQALADRMNLTATLSAQYRDDVWLDTAGDEGPPYNMQDSTTWLDARLALGIDDDRWLLALYGRNLTDEETKSHNYPFPFPADIIAGRTPTYVDGTDRFREIGVEVTYNF